MREGETRLKDDMSCCVVRDEIGWDERDLEEGEVQKVCLLKVRKWSSDEEVTRRCLNHRLVKDC